MGQIEDASFFEFVETRFAGKRLAVSTAFAAVGEADELTVECGVELSVGLMSGVVAQIQPRENMNTLGQECESGCPGPSRQTHAECLL